MLLPLLDPSNFFWMAKPGGKNTESVLFSVTVKKYKHVEHCVSLVWHWSMCSGKFGQPAAPSERDETVTGAWRTMPNVCKISRKIPNFCRTSVTRAWRERDGSVTKHRELCWNTGGKSTVLFPYLQAQTFSHVDWNIPFQPLFLIFSAKSGIT